MTNTLLDEPEAKAKPATPEPIILPTRHDVKIVLDALELRKDDLKKLATKTQAEGYPREAAVMSADAAALEHHVLPAFRSQRELPLVTPEQLEKNINAALKVPVNRAFEGMGDPKVIQTYESVMSRKEKLQQHLAVRVALYVREVAEEAYRQGMAAREQTAESIADCAIMTLRASGD